MSVTTRAHPLEDSLGGFPIHTLSSGDNEVEVSAFGGQILSWTRLGVPVVFENRDRAVMDGKTPYRGGAPICFPHFGHGTLLPHGTTLTPQHGPARVTIWDSAVRDRDSTVVLITRQPSAEEYGPTEFSLELTYALSDRLRIRADIRNVGQREAPFQFAVHTYWSTADPSTAVVRGLGNRYLDNLLGITEQTENDSEAPHQPPIDRVYLDAQDRQELATEAYDLVISTKGCSGAVLWNPGRDHTIQDLGSPDFVCLETGLFVPGKSLTPGEEHRIEIAFAVEVRGV